MGSLKSSILHHDILMMEDISLLPATKGLATPLRRAATASRVSLSEVKSFFQ